MIDSPAGGNSVDNPTNVPNPANPVPAVPAVELNPPDASASAPAGLDLEVVKRDLMTQFDKKMNERVAGFQRMIAEKDEKIRELQLNALPAHEREQVEIEENERYYARLEMDNWLLRKQAQNPKAADLLAKFLDAPDRDAQFDLLTSALGINTAPVSPSDAPQSMEGAPAVPDIDRNNPAPQNPSGPVTIAPDGTPIDAAFAERFIASLKEWPSR